MPYPVFTNTSQISFPSNRSPMVNNDLTPTNDWRKWFNSIQVSVSRMSFISFGSSYPDITSGPHSQGQIVINSLPTAGGFIGWVCVEPGSPGTWKTFGSISS